MAVSDWSGASLPWFEDLAELKARLGALFRRAEPRRQVELLLDGLIAGAARDNGVRARYAADPAPWRTQALLGRTIWDEEAARDICRDHVVERLRDRSAVMILDETDFPKKGRHSVGVARQRCEGAERVENRQIGVFLGYASPHGHALIDRRLHLPKDWAEDGERRDKAGVPADVEFAGRPAIGGAMIAAALEAGVPCAWVFSAAGYGGDDALRAALERRKTPYVLGLRGEERLIAADSRELAAADLAASLSKHPWLRAPAETGSSGPRLAAWARAPLLFPPWRGWDRWLLVRRAIGAPAAVSYYLAFAPSATKLRELAAVAGLRWTIDECFQSAKRETGLDHGETRSWRGWHRHVTLCMLAAAFLAGLRAHALRARSMAARDVAPPGADDWAGEDRPRPIYLQ